LILVSDKETEMKTETRTGTWRRISSGPRFVRWTNGRGQYVTTKKS
jgi:hypothetical protein